MNSRAVSSLTRYARLGIVALALGIGLFVGLGQDRGFESTPNAKLSSVNLQDLTWTEVALALEQGYDTAIVPTGGTEQNGPHVILGKHNYVIAAAAELVAKELGNTLVAPVIAYVPEGTYGDEPSLHMRFPGTIMDLSRFSAAPSARLSHLSFESDWAFPSEC